MERKISDLYNMLPFELTTGQKNALSMIETGRNTVVCGQAGSGKSFILQLLKDFYGDSALFCGSTGTSNAQLFNYKGGSGTCHRVWSLPLGIATPKDWKEVNKYTNTIFSSSDQVKIVVIDEAFMLNSEQLAIIHHRIKRFNKKTKKRKARNIQLVLVGDAGQAQPVVNSKAKKYFREEYGHEFMFFSKPFKEMDFQVALLNEVKRQEDHIFKAAMEVIRYGQEDRYEGVLKWLNKRVLPAPEDAMILAPTNAKVDYYNNKAFDANPNECFCYTAEVKDNYNVKNSPVPLELYLKEDLPVISLVNNPEIGVTNGTPMRVRQCTASGVYCEVIRTGEVVLIEPFTFEEHEVYVEGKKINEDGSTSDVLGSRVSGSFTSIPLKLSASLSFHRVQGHTLKSPVLLDMGNPNLFTKRDFGVNLLYVGLTRLSSPELLYLKEPLTKDFIKVCRDTLDWLDKVERY